MTARPISLCLAYYENPGMLLAQLEMLGSYPGAVQRQLCLVVVDDGSPQHPATLPAQLPFEARVYRMRKDVRWNQDACRNLAAREAPHDWLLLTDMDHLVPVDAMLAAMHGKLAKERAYTFSRVSAPDMAEYKPHPNSWLMHRSLYDRVGGYDERYAGIYGTDGAFRGNVERAALKVEQLKQALIRVPRDVIADASTTQFARKTSADAERKKEVARAIKNSGETRPVRGLFEWDRVR